MVLPTFDCFSFRCITRDIQYYLCWQEWEQYHRVRLTHETCDSADMAIESANGGDSDIPVFPIAKIDIN
jgi:hypothetical protein